MVIMKCCVPNCSFSTGMTRHRFPNPRTHPDLFAKWLEVLNVDELRVMTPKKVYENKRICFAHFEPRHKSPGNPRLHLLAVPTLNLLVNNSNSTSTITPDNEPCTSKDVHQLPVPTSIDLEEVKPVLASNSPLEEEMPVRVCTNTLLNTNKNKSQCQWFIKPLRISSIHSNVDDFEKHVQSELNKRKLNISENPNLDLEEKKQKTCFDISSGNRTWQPKMATVATNTEECDEILKYKINMNLLKLENAQLRKQNKKQKTCSSSKAMKSIDLNISSGNSTRKPKFTTVATNTEECDEISKYNLLKLEIAQLKKQNKKQADQISKLCAHILKNSDFK